MAHEGRASQIDIILGATATSKGATGILNKSMSILMQKSRKYIL